jgi:hypothetical protein
MDRKRFLKLFGLGVAGIATAKIVINETKRVGELSGVIGENDIQFYAGNEPFANGPFKVTKENIIVDNSRHFIIRVDEKGMRNFHNALNEYVKYSDYKNIYIEDING